MNTNNSISYVKFIIVQSYDPFFFFLSEKDVFVFKKTRNDITEILLKVALHTIAPFRENPIRH